jgi:hypothetical protein
MGVRLISSLVMLMFEPTRERADELATRVDSIEAGRE